MAQRPALPFARARSGPRPKGRGGAPKLKLPELAAQRSRLGPQFSRLSAALEEQRLTVGNEPEAVEPELILILDVAGDVQGFGKSLLAVPGFEFLGHQVLDKLPPDEEFAALTEQGQPTRYENHLYLVASDEQAWRELLSAWQRHTEGRPLPRGRAPWGHVFSQLRELREWNDQDRLRLGGAAECWKEDLLDRGDEIVPFEAELWFRKDANARQRVLRRLATDLGRLGGRVASEFAAEAAHYHGILAHAPARYLLDAAESGRFAAIQTGGIRLFHATGQMVAPAVGEAESDGTKATFGPRPTGSSRIALLDGVPLAAHEALDGRLLVDDPEGWEARTVVDDRRHGTAMASLVAHGAFDGDEQPLAEPVYVRPILICEAPSWVSQRDERLPADRLEVELVHNAVARLFEGDSPQAPDTRVIILAIGDRAQQYDRFVSPLARLLDWLSWRYRVLFIVSAGNHVGDLEIPSHLDLADIEAVEHHVLASLHGYALSRRLLAPAESVNALTVGAAHADASGTPATFPLIDPLTSGDLPSPVSPPAANGIGRAIKPEVLFPGGRQLLREGPPLSSRPRTLSIATTGRAPGTRVAAPGRNGALNTYAYDRGTSMAVGMAGHAAGVVLAQLDELRRMHDTTFPGAEFDAVLVKAALGHAARWRTARAPIEAMLTDAGTTATRATIARVLGYGRSDALTALVADDERAVLVGAGRIAPDDMHTYDLPLPECLGSLQLGRRLIVTLAWLTPVRPSHRAYRCVALALRCPAGRQDLFGGRQEADNDATQRGTLQHEVMANVRAVPCGPGETLPLAVSARTSMEGVADEVPYALLATVERADELASSIATSIVLPIYEQARSAIIERVRSEIRPGR